MSSIDAQGILFFVMILLSNPWAKTTIPCPNQVLIKLKYPIRPLGTKDGTKIRDSPPKRVALFPSREQILFSRQDSHRPVSAADTNLLLYLYPERQL